MKCRLFVNIVFILFASVATVAAQTVDDCRRLWEGVKFEDSHDVERRFADFAGLLTFNPDSVSTVERLEPLFEATGCSAVSLRTVAELADKYFYDVKSPVHNEEAYIFFLQKFLTLPGLPETDSLRADHTLAELRLNRVGHRVSDLVFQTVDAGNKSLIASLNQSGQTMLLLYNIDCLHCSEVLGKLGTSSRLNTAIADGRLRVIALHVGEADAEWKANAATLNGAWIKGAAPEAESTFALPELPAVYVIAPDGTVVAKNVDPRQFE